MYNGGLLMARLRYFDPQRRRPGLPSDVAALVESLADERAVLHLVNLQPDARARGLATGRRFWRA